MRAGADGLLARRLDLLEQVGRTGSISAAARAVGLSYRAAWAAVAQLNNAAETPLVVRRAGGEAGGGTRLTPAGRRLVESARRAQSRHRTFLRELPGSERELERAWGWLKRMSLKTSARNQFFGRVRRVRRGTVNAEVELSSGGTVIVASVTTEAVDELGLARGVEAVALVKASWVMLAAGARPPAVSARNRLRGVVERVIEGPVSCEVVLRLPGGRLLIAVVTRESAEQLGLRPGAPAWALFKASSVILGAWS